MQVIEKAYAKVNISLNLTGQKEHNLHYLVSMICFSDFYDTIVIEDSKFTEEEILFADLGRVRDIVTSPNGTLVLATDGPAGKLIRVQRK